MSLHLHRSNRTELLVAEMAAVFDHKRLSPLDREQIVVDGRGMERWLSLELARRNGIWANPGFVFPRRIVLEAMNAVLGADDALEGFTETLSRYEPEVMMWVVADLLPGLLEKRSFAAVRRYLGDAEPGSRRFVALCERIARTFDDYAVFRHQMVLGWEGQAKTGQTKKDPDLPDDQQWQPVLWRALVERLGEGHMASRAQAFLEALTRGDALDPAFPRRLSLFGLSTMAPLYLRMLLALHQQVELHLFVLEPTEHFWSDIKSEVEAFRIARHQGRPEEELYLTVGNPLLASLGKQGRDFRLVLDSVEQVERIDHEQFAWPGPTGPSEPTTMLATLQRDILDLVQRRAPRSDEESTQTSSTEVLPPLPLDPADRSISVHACHGPMREVEVLHDQLLALIDKDPTLLPGDVVVMAPEIDAYAPYIDAIFGAAAEEARIRHTVADRGVRATHALVDAFFKVLDTLRGRLTAPEVLELLSDEPVRDRFGMAQDDRIEIERWITEVGIRWGEDAAHRRALGHPELGHNTWRFGLDRLLLGLAMPLGERALYQGVLPYDDVEGSAGELLGKLADLCQSLSSYRDRIAHPMGAAEWQETLASLASAFIRAPDRDEFQLNLLLEALAGMADRATLAGFDAEIEYEPIRAQLETMLEAGRSSRGFLSGGITFCSTVPMRAIPFRVVCMLGMNDDTFPRSVHAPGFDLLGRRHMPGDRSVRDDDRYLFLEALLSAREQLIITYEGQSIRDNTTKPPSVVVSELLDVVSDSFYLPDLGLDSDPLLDPEHTPGSQAMREAVRARVEVRHPLQPFSPRYFDPAGDARLFSFSAHGREVAASLGTARTDRPLFAESPIALSDELTCTVSLDELARFFKQPTQTYLQRAMGLYLEKDDPELEETEPIELSGLDQWNIYDPMLARLREGTSAETAAALTRAGGRLPLSVFGEEELKANVPEVEKLAAMAQGILDGEPLEDLDVDIEVGGTRVTGILRDIWPRGQVRVQFSKSNGYHELACWVRHLALGCVAPDGYPRTSFLVARSSSTKEPTVITYRPVEQPREMLERLVRIYLLGLQVPLPLFKNATWAFARTWWDNGKKEDKGRTAAKKKYDGDEYMGWAGDRDDSYVRQLFADLDPLASGFCLVPLPGQEVPDFETLAKEIFEPLLDNREGAL